MQNGIILQVQGLGVPVQTPSDRVEAGYVLGWSSDPDCPVDAPAHVLIGDQQLKRFLKMAIDPRFLSGDLIKIVPVTVEDGQTSLSREACISQYQINPDNWNMTRIALVISGNTSTGPLMDMHEWVGTREEFAEGTHMREAFQHGINRGIKSPSIYTPTEGGHIHNAAEFLQNYRRLMKPSLRYAEILRTHLDAALVNLDTENMSGERAIHVLREIQQAARMYEQQHLIELEDLGVDTANDQRKAQEQVKQAESDNTPAPAPAQRRSGPMMH